MIMIEDDYDQALKSSFAMVILRAVEDLLLKCCSLTSPAFVTNKKVVA